jgi:hypothetical protein
MPSHYGKKVAFTTKDGKSVSFTPKNKKKEKESGGMKPTMKPRKELDEIQKKLLKEVAPNHSKEHIAEMKKQMKKGFCFQQAHKLALKNVGK